MAVSFESIGVDVIEAIDMLGLASWLGGRKDEAGGEEGDSCRGDATVR